jgi:hypothetical protein
VTARYDETRDDIVRVIDDWLQERVAGLPAPHHAVQSALSESRATPQARRRAPGRWVDRLGVTRRPDDRIHEASNTRTTRFTLGLVTLDGTVAWSNSGKVVAAAVMASALGTALLIAGPVTRHPGGAGAELPPVTGPAGNGLIAFSRDGDIYVGDPVTGEATAIVTGPAFDADPKFSPDGTHIAYYRNAAENTPESPMPPPEIHVVRPDGSGDRVLDGPKSSFFWWTPDSDGLVVNHHGGFDTFGLLTLLDVSGAAAPQLMTPPMPIHQGQFPYSADTDVAGFFQPPTFDRVLVADWGDGSTHRPSEWIWGPPLAVMKLEGIDFDVLIEPSWMIENDYGVIQHSAWSPDGSRISFTTMSPSGSRAAFVMDTDGSDIRRLDSYGPWSPDSSSIAMGDARDDDEPGEGIVIVDVATGTERELDVTLSSPGCDCWLLWSPDGRSLLIPGSDFGLLIDVETGTTTELPWEIEGWTSPSWQRVALD